jgi:hypothetical protein
MAGQVMQINNENLEALSSYLVQTLDPATRQQGTLINIFFFLKEYI